jgi:hypothetical protein
MLVSYSMPPPVAGGILMSMTKPRGYTPGSVYVGSVLEAMIEHKMTP